MKSITITIVRIYMTESAKLVKPIMDYLHNEAKVRGVSVFRAISGYGDSGEHNTNCLDLSLNLPLVLEFFDTPEKVKTALAYLGTLVHAEHIIFWDAQTLGA